MSFERGTVLFLCVIAAFLLVGFTAHCINHNVEVVDSKFITAESASNSVLFAYEDLTADYHANKSNTEVIQADEKAVLDAQENYIIATTNLGKLASKDTFCKILKYSLYINDLAPTTYTIDDTKLMDSETNTLIKRDILGSLFADNAAYHGFFKGISTLFGDHSVYKYSRDDCPEAQQNIIFRSLGNLKEDANT
jgi:hypothetical protein